MFLCSNNKDDSHKKVTKFKSPGVPARILRPVAARFAVTESYGIWHFGDTEKMVDQLGDLVRLGVKTATSAFVWELESNKEKIPKVGDIGVVTR